LWESRVEVAWLAPAAAGREYLAADLPRRSLSFSENTSTLAPSPKPSLIVTPGGFDFRMVRRHRRSWNGVERIDIRHAAGRVAST
jgi:hypothetical protein